jgi:hypothetical protein
LRNNQTSISHLSVFNTPQDVKDIEKACKEYNKVLDKTIEAKRKYNQTVESD